MPGIALRRNYIFIENKPALHSHPPKAPQAPGTGSDPKNLPFKFNIKNGYCYRNTLSWPDGNMQI